MANALTKFGQLCRNLRSQHDRSMGDQAEAFGCEAYEISAVETGRNPASPAYVEKFASWLGLPDSDRRDLEKRITSNVVAFKSAGGSRSSSMRLFRKVSRMDPNQIRGMKQKPPSLRPQDDGRL